MVLKKQDCSKNDRNTTDYPSEEDGVLKHGAAPFHLYNTKQLLTLYPVSTGVKGLAGQI